MPLAFRRHARLGAILIALLVVTEARLPAQEDVRALWVVRTTLTSPAAIEAMVAAAHAGGFNTLLVQVRGRGDAFYAHALEPRAAQLSGQPPSFDPLAHTIARAHAAGIRVHAWISTNLISSVVELPKNRDHVIYRHPEWLMVPRAIASGLVHVDPSDPRYLESLVRYLKGRTGDVEGLYVSPVVSNAADYTTRVVANLVRHYPLDGLHLDYIRYPAADFDYSRGALDAFRRSISDELTGEVRREHNARLASDPFAYVDAFPERWHEFRQSQLTLLVTRIRRAVKSERPAALLSAAVIPDPGDATRSRLQNWPGWIASGLLDVVCPMVYTTDAARFERQVTTVRSLAARHALWTGIGAYQLSEEQIAANIRTARRIDVGGIILFSYDSLAGTPRGPSYVAELGRAMFAP